MEYYRRVEVPTHHRVQVLITTSIMTQVTALGPRGIIIQYKNKEKNAENHNSVITQNFLKFQCALNVPEVRKEEEEKKKTYKIYKATGLL